MKKATYFLSFALLLGDNASAASWRSAGEGEDGTFAQFDTESFKATDDIATVWIAYDFSANNTESARSAKSRIEIDCREHTVRTLSIIRYSRTGAILQDNSTPFSSFGSIIPDSLGDNIAKTICSYKDLRARVLR